LAICGIAAGARIIPPDTTEIALAIDPDAGARGCAAYWPAEPGVHTVVQPGRDGRQTFAFLVMPEGAFKTIAERQIGEATAVWAAEQSAAITRDTPERRGPAWPYFLAWLILSGALWFGERRFRAGYAR
jgi:hypothetical protein